MKIRCMLRNAKQSGGYNIIEVMVSFTIITVALTGILSLVIMNMQVRVVKRGLLVASMLSQEGIELVRNIRDDNKVVKAYDFDDDIGDTDGDFIIDWNGRNSIDEVPDDIDLSSNETRLYYDGNHYYHSGASGEETLYYRIIKVVTNPDYIAASSTVMWQDQKGEHSYITETLLYDWL